MMNTFKLLFKREFKALINNIRIKGLLNNFINLLIYLVLIGILIFLFVELTSGFNTYGLGYEIFTIILTFLLSVQIITSIKPIVYYVFQNKDYYILQPLPIKPEIILVTKLLITYLKELLKSLMLIIPLGVAFGILNDAGFIFYMLFIIVILMLPFMVVSFALILALPYLKIESFFKRNGLLKLGWSLFILTILFVGYRKVLGIIIKLINDNQLRFLINADVANQIKNSIKYLVPFNFFTNVLANQSLILNFILSFLVIISLVIISIWVSRFNYLRLVKSKIESTKKIKSYILKSKSAVFALVKKELLTILRSSELSFSYLSVLILLPLISYLLVFTLNQAIAQIIGQNYLIPFALMFEILLVGVSNTMAGIIISKEGKSMTLIKIMPISYKVQINVKVLLLTIMMQLALLITNLVLILTKEFTWIEGIAVWGISSLISQGLMLLAINKDLEHPHFKGDLNNHQHTTSYILNAIFAGIIVGLLALIIYLLYNFEMMILLTSGLGILVLTLSTSKLYRNLNKKVSRIIG